MHFPCHLVNLHQVGQHVSFDALLAHEKAGHLTYPQCLKRWQSLSDQSYLTPMDS